MTPAVMLYQVRSEAFQPIQYMMTNYLSNEKRRPFVDFCYFDMDRALLTESSEYGADI